MAQQGDMPANGLPDASTQHGRSQLEPIGCEPQLPQALCVRGAGSVTPLKPTWASRRARKTFKDVSGGVLCRPLATKRIGSMFHLATKAPWPLGARAVAYTAQKSSSPLPAARAALKVSLQAAANGIDWPNLSPMSTASLTSWPHVESVGQLDYVPNEGSCTVLL